MTAFSKTLRTFALDQIGTPGEHKPAQIAAEFLDRNPDLAREYIRELAERRVAELVKDLCDEPAQDPLPLFSGFPAAITVAPGVVKAIDHCNLDDLGAGLAYRADNVRNAQKRLEEYRLSMAKFDMLRERPDETVGELSQRLRDSAA